ncbi:MAG: LPS assembly lipoprotein LptE [Bacteroidota bacterium]
MLKQARFLLFLFLLAFAGCYSFKGISIPPEANTFTIQPFQNTSASVPTLAQTLTESLKQRIIGETRLRYAADEGDIEYSGTITEFRVSAVAPQADATTQFSRLDITVSVSCDNPYDVENPEWNSRFSRFAEFESTTNFLDVRDDLIEEINEQLIEDIFNRTFTNW